LEREAGQPSGARPTPTRIAETARPVFVRRQTVALRCPKSIITAQSLGFIEQFLYWKQWGGDLWESDAKSADALLVLRKESEKETMNEEE
jgi:hypothetical protein